MAGIRGNRKFRQAAKQTFTDVANSTGFFGCQVFIDEFQCSTRKITKVMKNRDNFGEKERGEEGYVPRSFLRSDRWLILSALHGLFPALLSRGIQFPRLGQIHHVSTAGFLRNILKCDKLFLDLVDGMPPGLVGNLQIF